MKEHDLFCISEEHDTRSCVRNFADALDVVDDLLAKYAAIKQDATGAKWRTQSPRDHLAHAYGHVRASIRFIDGRAEDDCEEDLASTACRALMALQLYLEQKAQAPPPPPAR